MLPQGFQLVGLFSLVTKIQLSHAVKNLKGSRDLPGSDEEVFRHRTRRDELQTQWPQRLYLIYFQEESNFTVFPVVLQEKITPSVYSACKLPHLKGSKTLQKPGVGEMNQIPSMSGRFVQNLPYLPKSKSAYLGVLSEHSGAKLNSCCEWGLLSFQNTLLHGELRRTWRTTQPTDLESC